MKKILPLLIVAVLAAVAAKKILLEKENQQRQGNAVIIFGNIDIREVQLAFESPGRIEELMVEEGDHVKRGDLLGLLDDSTYQAEVQRLKAEVDAQEQIVAKMMAGSRTQEIEAARAEVEALRAKVHNALINYKRLKNLAHKKFIQQQALDDAEAQLKALKAELEAAKQRLGLIVEGPRKEDISAAKAVLEAKKSALKLAEKHLKDTRLYSPKDGIIENRILEPGSMAFPQTPVFTLALKDPLWVRAYIPESDLGKLRQGMKAVVKSDSFPGKEYEGWIGYISPVAEFTPKQVETTELRTKLVYQCRVFVCNHEDELRLGMPVTVEIPLDQEISDVHQNACKASEGGNS